MIHDPDKIDDAVLALLWHNEQDSGDAWKTMPWDATDRLFEKGLIHDPRRKRKSLQFTEEGAAAAEQTFERLFGKAR
jgi:hypothetical protein